MVKAMEMQASSSLESGWRQPMADTLLRARWPLKPRGFGRKLSLFLSIDTAQRIQDLSPRAAVLLGLCSY